MTQHVMLDLETLSTEANAVILSIGAVWFDPHGRQFEAPVVDHVVDGDYPYHLFPLCFERKIDIQTCLDVGRSVSGNTLSWWAIADDEARKSAFSGETGLREALNDFADFIQMVSLGWPKQNPDDVELAVPIIREDVCVWGHGAAFDNVILANAYHNLGYAAPWNFRFDRCNRTFLASAEERGVKPELVRLGTFHNALDDAITQALHMQRVNALLLDRQVALLEAA